MVNPIDNSYLDLSHLDFSKFESNGKVNQGELDQWIRSYAAQVQASGSKEVTLSCGQVCDLQALLGHPPANGAYISPQDPLMKLSQTSVQTVNGPESLLQYISTSLKGDYGLSVHLSFGGIHALPGSSGNPSDWDFQFNKESPQNLAYDLAKWANLTGISKIDFDVSSYAGQTLTQTNNPSDLRSFFQQLHSFGAANGVQTTMTVPGNPGDWSMFPEPEGQNYLQNLFMDSSNNPVSVTSMFDGFNINPYDEKSGTYNFSGDTLIQWMKDFSFNQNDNLDPQKAASFFHIGFCDNVDYNNPASNTLQPAPPFHMPPGLTSGQAAANLFQQWTAQASAYFGAQPPLVFGEPNLEDVKADYSMDPSGATHLLDQDPFNADFAGYLTPHSPFKNITDLIAAVQLDSHLPPAFVSKMLPFLENLRNINPNSQPNSFIYLIHFVEAGLVNNSFLSELNPTQRSEFNSLIGNVPGGPAFSPNISPEQLGNDLMFMVPFLTKSRATTLIDKIIPELQGDPSATPPIAPKTPAEIYTEWTTPPKNQLGAAPWLSAFFVNFLPQTPPS